MREAEIDAELCDGCQDCLEECVYEAITMVRSASEKRLKAVVDPESCCGCHLCAVNCPLHGIEMRWLGRPVAAEMVAAR